jgi:predicted  nucleic acid-binding Zn-ribbon protein
MESIHILKPGKFELDLVNLLNKDHPLVYKLEEGKYMIDVPSTLQMRKGTKINFD